MLRNPKRAKDKKNEFNENHFEWLQLEKENNLIQIENAKLQKEVLLLQKEILQMQKEKLTDYSQYK